MGIVSSLLGFFSPPTSHYKIADVYRGLRSQVFALKASDSLIRPESEVLATVMETGYPEAVATLVAVGDGTASLYFSNGGGIIGMGEREGPRKACAAFLSSVEKYLGQMSKVKSYPLPKPGQTIFYVCTVHGVFSAERPEQVLGEGGDPLSPLFFSGQNLITEMRLGENG